MKMTFPIVVDIPDENIQKFAEECEADIIHYRNGVIEEWKETIEEMIEEMDGCKLDKENIIVEEMPMDQQHILLTENDIIQDGDEEWVYDYKLDGWHWREVSCLSMGEYFQKGLDVKIRRKVQ